MARGLVAEIQKRNDRIIEMALEGRSPKEIARIFAVSYQSVKFVLSRGNVHERLRAERDRKIGSLADEGLPQKEIVKRTGSSATVVCQTLLRLDGRTHKEHGKRPAKPPEPAPVITAVDPKAMSLADEDRLRELVGRGVPITAIAALMRKNYTVLIAAMERLQLTRVNA